MQCMRRCKYLLGEAVPGPYGDTERHSSQPADLLIFSVVVKNENRMEIAGTGWWKQQESG